MNNHFILVIGLGNPILGDDGVGWHVAKMVQDELKSTPDLAKQVEVDCLAVGGLSLMERMAGYNHVILVDAMMTANHPLGTVICSELGDLHDQATGHLSSSHDITLQHALELGRMSGAQIPHSVTIIGIVAKHVYDFSDQLTLAVARAVPEAAQRTINIINQINKIFGGLT